jgi:hypothetical protein
MPLAGLVLNRVHRTGVRDLTADRSLAAAERLEAEGASPATASALRLHAELVSMEARERRIASRFTSTHPAVPIAEVPAQPEDVHDLAGLRTVGAALADQA